MGWFAILKALARIAITRRLLGILFATMCGWITGLVLEYRDRHNALKGDVPEAQTVT